jgi:hypothetical protein
MLASTAFGIPTDSDIPFRLKETVSGSEIPGPEFFLNDGEGLASRYT